MKNTMNQREVARFHRLLREEVSMEDCSKAIKVSVNTLEKFTPEFFAKLKKGSDKKGSDKKTEKGD